jgi:hypothetical protein
MQLKILEIRSLRMTNPSTALRARVVSYAVGAFTVFIESIVVETSKRVHSIGICES